MTSQQRTLSVFNNITLDGYICDNHGDMSWAHLPGPDPEWDAFTNSNATGGGALLFGRTTYDMMAAFWPTKDAAAKMPHVAEAMNTMPKYVASATILKPTWNNTTVLRGELETEVQKLLATPGPNITIMGSGTIIPQLIDIIDIVTLVVVPVVIGAGKTMFKDVARLPLKLASTRKFENGRVVLTYTA